MMFDCVVLLSLCICHCCVGFKQRHAHLTTVVGLKPRQAEHDEKRESVHIKLNEMTEGVSADVGQRESVAVLTELVKIRTNETEFAVEGRLSADRDRLRLESFVKHQSDKNVTAMLASNEYALVERFYDLGDENIIAQLGSFFKTEKLLSSSKEFPPSQAYVQGILPEAVQFETKVQRHAKRVMMLPPIQEDEAILTFLTTPTPLTTLTLELGSNEGAGAGGGGGGGWMELFNSYRGRGLFEREKDSVPTKKLFKEPLKQFLLYFRERLPYYYSQCLSTSCGNKDLNSYLGVAYPRPQERCNDTRAAVCELVLCGNCSTISRFPRFNALGAVITAGRGRCGEYSVLMLRMLELLGFQARLVVDWDDHMWVEVLLPSNPSSDSTSKVQEDWVHIDPCEAAIDENLIYQGWGKNSTFCFAFDRKGDIQDVTMRYTSHVPEVVEERRISRGVDSAAVNAALDRVRGVGLGAV